MYNGGNPTSPNDPTLLDNIRASIFSQGNSSVTALQESADNYGSLVSVKWGGEPDPRPRQVGFLLKRTMSHIPTTSDGSVWMMATPELHGLPRV